MKILYVTTIISTAQAFLTEHVEMLIKNGHQVELATNNNSFDEKIDKKIPLHHIDFSRSIRVDSIINSYQKIAKLIEENNYDIIHTHTPIASAITRLAARKTDSKVIYTAHGFHFHKNSPKKHWLIYYPMEKWLSKYTDILITINEEDYKISKEKFFAKENFKMHGVGLKPYKSLSYQEKKDLRSNLDIPENTKIFMSIGELNSNKNHLVVLKALKEINEEFVYLIAGKGPNKEQLESYISKSPQLKDKVKLIGYRKDVRDLLQITDLFIFPSKREGLPVSVMEAMYAKVPVIGSNIRGINDLIRNNNFLVDNFLDEKEWQILISTFFINMDSFEQSTVSNSKLIKKYMLDEVLTELENIYNILS